MRSCMLKKFLSNYIPMLHWVLKLRYCRARLRFHFSSPKFEVRNIILVRLSRFPESRGDEPDETFIPCGQLFLKRKGQHE